MIKKIAYIILFSIVSVTAFSQVKVIAPVTTNAPADLYPTHYDSLGFAGFRVLANTTARDAISSSRRKNGMFVYTVADSSVWRLDSTQSPIWVLYSKGNPITTIPNLDQVLTAGNSSSQNAIINQLGLSSGGASSFIAHNPSQQSFVNQYYLPYQSVDTILGKKSIIANSPILYNNTTATLSADTTILATTTALIDSIGAKSNGWNASTLRDSTSSHNLTQSAYVRSTSGLASAYNLNAQPVGGGGLQFGGLFSNFVVHPGLGLTPNELAPILTAVYDSSGTTIPSIKGLETGIMFLDGASTHVGHTYGIAVGFPTLTNSSSIDTVVGVEIMSKPTINFVAGAAFALKSDIALPFRIVGTNGNAGGLQLTEGNGFAQIGTGSGQVVFSPSNSTSTLSNGFVFRDHNNVGRITFDSLGNILLNMGATNGTDRININGNASWYGGGNKQAAIQGNSAGGIFTLLQSGTGVTQFDARSGNVNYINNGGALVMGRNSAIAGTVIYIQDTSRAALVSPSMTSQQFANIASVPGGATFYDNVIKRHMGYDGTNRIRYVDSVYTGDLYVTGNVGINTTTLTYAFNVKSQMGVQNGGTTMIYAAANSGTGGNLSVNNSSGTSVIQMDARSGNISYINNTGGLAIGRSSALTGAMFSVNTTSLTSVFAPVMTYTQFKAISSPATGGGAFVTGANAYAYYDGTTYRRLYDSAAYAAGIDMILTPALNTLTFSADTTTGAAKLATQGFVTRNLLWSRASSKLTPVTATDTVYANYLQVGTSPNNSISNVDVENTTKSYGAILNTTGNITNNGLVGFYGQTNVTGALGESAVTVSVGSSGRLNFNTTSNQALFFGSHHDGVWGGIVQQNTGNVTGSIVASVEGNSEFGSSGDVDSVADFLSMYPVQLTGVAGYSGTIANHFGLYIRDISKSNIVGRITNKWGIYQKGATETNVLNGTTAYANVYTTSATPSATPGTGAGTGGTVSIVGGNDGGVITINTGTSPATSATIASVVFSNSFAFPTGCSIMIFAANANAAGLSTNQHLLAAGTTTGFTLTSQATNLSAGTTYIYNYQVKGY